MRKFDINNETMLQVYNDGNSMVYAQDFDARDTSILLRPRRNENDVPFYVSMSFENFRKLAQVTTLIESRVIRVKDIEEGFEEAVLDRCGIDINNREVGYYTKEVVDEMIIHPVPSTIMDILAIKNRDIINRLYQRLIYLKNQHSYFISYEIEEYIRARKEELSKGIIESELKGMTPKNVDEPVYEEENEEVEEVVEVVEVVKNTPAKKAPAKRKTTAKKTTTKTDN